MKNTLITLLITTFFSLSMFAQGGPKVDAIKFRGKITTVVRNSIDVPVGETWLIHNVTTNQIEFSGEDDAWNTVGDGLQEGQNIVSSFSVSTSTNNGIYINPDTGDGESISLWGGGQPDGVRLLLGENSILTQNYSTSDIDSDVTGRFLITKEWFQDNIGGGISTDNQNRINNQNKLILNIKTTDFDYSSTDIERSSGLDVGSKVVVAVDNGNSYEGALQDSDMQLNQVILKQARGSGSEIVSYFEDGESGQFTDLVGNIGNQWTVSSGTRGTGIKESANLIVVDGGVVSNRLFGSTELNTSGGATSPTELNSVGSWDVVNSNSSISSVANTDTQGGSFMLQIRANGTGVAGQFANLNIPVENGSSYTVTYRSQANPVNQQRSSGFWDGGTTSGGSVSDTANWSTHTRTFTATSTTFGLQMYVSPNASTVDGDILNISEISVIKN